MSVGGDDDTLAGSLPTMTGAPGKVGETSELVAGRYRIVRWLGGGGMGRVYEAVDTELDEHVALKVLSGALGAEAVERFRREVKLTRRIVHRNVARMFDIGEFAGERFLTMELVDGEALTRAVTPPVPWPKLRAIAEQLCAGLTAAHAAGIVHRDLKPDNVLVERGTARVVITDFGIARGGDDPGVTQVGAVVGTPRYMAPEQLAGRAVDARADLFSLGVMLFELATGTRPWSGDSAIAIAVAQATEQRRALDTTSSDAPAAFATIVGACLQLEPEHRPARADLIADALASGNADALDRGTPETRIERPSMPPAAPRARTVPAELSASSQHAPTTLAVLPIACAPGDEYLADGLQEDLTDTLSTTPGLRVRPPGIARGQQQDPRELGRQLAVDHVVVASLRRAQAMLRVSARLIGIADGFQIWAHKLECSEAEVLQASSELARGVAAALSTHATSQTRPIDPRAVDLYLRARAELRRFWANHTQAATELLEKATEYAPTSGPILGALAWASVQAWVLRGEPELRPIAERAIERGLAAGSGEAHLAAAQLAFNIGQPERGARELALALAHAPMLAQAHELAGKILVEIVGAVEARYHFETAAGLDPGRAAIVSSELARLEALEGKWESSDARVAALLADPDPSIKQLGSLFRTRLAGWRGRRAEANSDALDIAPRLGDRAAVVLSFIFDVEATGQFDRARWRELMTSIATTNLPVRTQLIGLQLLAEAAAITHDEAAMFETLELAEQRGLLDIVWLDRCSVFTPWANDATYSTIRRAVDARARRVLTGFRSVATG